MHYIFNMKIGEKIIKARAFTYREFQQLIQAKAEGTLADVVIDTVYQCTGLNANELSKQEAELIFLFLWCNSLRKTKIDATWVCGDCGKETEYQLNIDKAHITESEDFLLDLGQVKIKFRAPKFTEDEDVMQMIVKCMELVIVDGQEFNISEVNENDFETILNMLTKEHVENIINELTKNQITLAVPIKCECGQSGVYSIQGLSGFLKIL